MPYIVSQKRDRSDPAGHLASVVADGSGFIVGHSSASRSLLTIEEFYRVGEPIVAECIEGGQACSLAIFDIDRLFRIADAHGQEAADDVLAQFGAILMDKASLRGMSVAHLGFDQFGLLLPGSGGAAATEVFDDLRQELVSCLIGLKGEMITLSLSAGVVEIHGLETFDNYLNAAEQFLFIAKMSGRNQVVSDHTFSAAH